MSWLEINLFIIAYTVFACVFLALFTIGLIALDSLDRWLYDKYESCKAKVK